MPAKTVHIRKDPILSNKQEREARDNSKEGTTQG